MSSLQYFCTNWSPNVVDCKKFGGYTCKNCFLVTYCGSNCQRSHWPLHRKDCKSPLRNESWVPAWTLEKRTPDFIGEGIQKQFGGNKYLWGNIPAFNALQLGANEGANYRGHLRMLFAASGDLRNVITTIGQIPRSYNQSTDITINDREFAVVGRNAIILLVALELDNIEEAVDCIIHVWYSALIRKSDLDILQRRIRPLIESVCEKIKNKAPSCLLGKTWIFGERSIRLVLSKDSWDSLLSFTDIPEGLTAEHAIHIRQAVTLAEPKKDYRDRHLFFQSPSRRMAKFQFWKDGLLLPFGFPRSEFREPNPTFFQTTDAWPLKDNADPLNGWSSKEVQDISCGPATADIYGKLFYHVRAVLRTCLSRLSSLEVSFRLFQMDACELPAHLEKGSFSRIEVSNISDGGYLGIHRTLAFMVPLLEEPLINPYASLITLFMNAVEEVLNDYDRMSDFTLHSLTTQRLLKYSPLPTTRRTEMYDPELLKFILAQSLVANYDHIFDRYMAKLKFSEVAQYFGAAMKEKHTVIDKWPFRLKLQPDQPGAQEEFDRLLSGGDSGKERYVEWKRVHTCGMAIRTK